jgi:Zn-finger nucleic acid-binding protein
MAGPEGMRNGVVEKLDSAGNCPACGGSWDGGDILESFTALREKGAEYYKNKTDEELKQIAGQYGWTVENPQRFSKLIGVELPYSHPQHYDGVSFWRCPHCKAQWSRFGNA